MRTTSLRRACTAVLLLFAAALPAGAQTVRRELFTSGPTGQRINIVLLAEGYVAGQEEDFFRDARRVLDDFLLAEPYATYARYFNAFGVFVPSVQTGSDHPARNVYRNTYFNSYYDCSGIPRLICLDGVGLSRAQDVLREQVPEHDIPVVVVNDEEYGGSGGPISVTSIDPSAAEIAIHEVGHSFASLADEYGGGDGLSSYEAPNATAERRRDHIRWRHWIEPSTPIPTPNDPVYAAVVGLFEGAVYSDENWFRPKYECKMRSLNVPFCEVCREQHVAAIYNLVSPVAASAPAAQRVSLGPTDTLAFRADPMEPAGHALDVQWFVDDVAVEAARGAAFALAGAAVAPGPHVVSAVVRDATPMVRDPALRPLLEARVTWDVTRRGATAADPPADVPAYRLEPTYPNPARGETTFAFTLAEPSPVTLTVFDVTGRAVAVVASGAFAPGRHELRWQVSALAAGLYLYRLETPTFRATRRLVVLP